MYSRSFAFPLLKTRWNFLNKFSRAPYWEAERIRPWRAEKERRGAKRERNCNNADKKGQNNNAILTVWVRQWFIGRRDRDVLAIKKWLDSLAVAKIGTIVTDSTRRSPKSRKSFAGFAQAQNNKDEKRSRGREFLWQFHFWRLKKIHFWKRGVCSSTGDRHRRFRIGGSRLFCQATLNPIRVVHGTDWAEIAMWANLFSALASEKRAHWSHLARYSNWVLNKILVNKVNYLL